MDLGVLVNSLVGVRYSTARTIVYHCGDCYSGSYVWYSEVWPVDCDGPECCVLFELTP